MISKVNFVENRNNIGQKKIENLRFIVINSQQIGQFSQLGVYTAQDLRKEYEISIPIETMEGFFNFEEKLTSEATFKIDVVKFFTIRNILHSRGPRDQILHQIGGGKVRHQKAGNKLPTFICRKRNTA